MSCVGRAGLALVGMLAASQAVAVGTAALGTAEVEFSRQPEALVISFGEVWPELKDQDPTPLVRVYGDGRVVVHFAAYMKRAGQYELRLTPREMDALVLRLAPVLLEFDEAQVAREKQLAEELLQAEALDDQPTLFYVADAEISVFVLNIESYRPPGPPGLTISKPRLERSWTGLRFDAERYPQLAPVQALMEMERMLRGLTEREDLARVEP